MKIEPGSDKWLKKAKGWRKRKVWKKTNQWYYCPLCMVLYFFRVFKCRFDFTVPIQCPCGNELKQAPESELREAKIAAPHFKPRGWYTNGYLQSDLWKTIRQRVLSRDGNACQRCGMAAEVVHHKSYHASVLAGQDDSQLISLCCICHEFIEFNDDGNKTKLRVANARLER